MVSSAASSSLLGVLAEWASSESGKRSIEAKRKRSVALLLRALESRFAKMNGKEDQEAVRDAILEEALRFSNKFEIDPSLRVIVCGVRLLQCSCLDSKEDSEEKDNSARIALSELSKQDLSTIFLPEESSSSLLSEYFVMRALLDRGRSDLARDYISMIARDLRPKSETDCMTVVNVFISRGEWLRAIHFQRSHVASKRIRTAALEAAFSWKIKEASFMDILTVPLMAVEKVALSSFLEKAAATSSSETQVRAQMLMFRLALDEGRISDAHQHVAGGNFKGSALESAKAIIERFRLRGGCSDWRPANARGASSLAMLRAQRHALSAERAEQNHAAIPANASSSTNTSRAFTDTQLASPPKDGFSKPLRRSHRLKTLRAEENKLRTPPLPRQLSKRRKRPLGGAQLLQRKSAK